MAKFKNLQGESSRGEEADPDLYKTYIEKTFYYPFFFIVVILNTNNAVSEKKKKRRFSVHFVADDIFMTFYFHLNYYVY